MAELVVNPSLLRILEDFVGFGSLFEPLFGFLVVGVPVGVKLLGLMPVGFLDFRLTGPPVDLQDLVVIALGAHELFRSRSEGRAFNSSGGGPAGLPTRTRAGRNNRPLSK